MRQILQGVAYLHDHGIIHRSNPNPNPNPKLNPNPNPNIRDLKPDNVCLTATLQPAIIDFGISKNKSQLGNTTTVVNATAGTEGYVAPEIIHGKGSSSASDMWACGAMLYRALVGEVTPEEIRSQRQGFLKALTLTPNP